MLSRNKNVFYVMIHREGALCHNEHQDNPDLSLFVLTADVNVHGAACAFRRWSGLAGKRKVAGSIPVLAKCRGVPEQNTSP